MSYINDIQALISNMQRLDKKVLIGIIIGQAIKIKNS